MKHLHIYLEDREYEELQKVKGSQTWHDLLMSCVEKNNEK
jgi:hypothetical protein